MEENKDKKKTIELFLLIFLLVVIFAVVISKIAAPKKIVMPQQPKPNLSVAAPVTAKQPAAPVVKPAPIEIAPQDAKGFYQRGLTYYYRSDFDNAINDFKKATELDPKYADAYCEMGVSYMEKAQWDNAIGTLKKCIDIDPNYPKAQYAIAVSYARKPQPDVKAAREHFEISKKLGFVYPKWFEDFLKRLESGERFGVQQQGAAKQ